MSDVPIVGTATELAILDTLRRIERGQSRILARLAGLESQGEDTMTLQQDLLDAVAAETTAVDSVIAFIQGLVANNVISSDAAASLLASIRGDKDRLEAAITANLGG